MTDPIADVLVLVFTYGVSLRQWQDTGMLGREWALYRELLPHYRKVVLVTYGGADDPGVLEPLLRRSNDQSKVSVVCNAQNQAAAQYVASLPERVLAEVGEFGRVVVKTNQMAGGDVAVRVADALRTRGKLAALIARGGYLWTRFVAHEHGPHSPQATDAASRERVLCSAAHAVVGTTADMVQDLAWRYGLDPYRTNVIPNYVLTDQEPVPVAQRERGLLLYAGQLIPRKRVSVLIQALSLIPKHFRDGLRLEVIGDGTERANLEELATQLEAPVTFISRMPHDQLLERMRKCTFYLQASELEGHPKTVLEAMATGAVTVVADSPGMEVIHHGLTGLRLAPEPKLFAHTITDMLADTDWRESMGASAAHAVRKAFSLEAVVEQEKAVHRRALEVAGRSQRGRAVA